MNFEFKYWNGINGINVNFKSTLNYWHQHHRSTSVRNGALNILGDERIIHQQRYRPSGSNISVTIPNLVRQMRISAFNFFSVAKSQKFWKTGDGQGSACKKCKMSRLMSKPAKWLCAQWVAKDPSFLHADSEDWSDWADVQADLSLRWAQSLFVGFVWGDSNKPTMWKPKSLRFMSLWKVSRQLIEDKQ